MLVCLVGCGGTPLPGVQEQCLEIDRAADEYTTRCMSKAYDLADCSKVWSVEAPEGYTLEACLQAWASQPCGAGWPTICPTQWPRAPWYGP
jgi:hypothetical protein